MNDSGEPSGKLFIGDGIQKRFPVVRRFWLPVIRRRLDHLGHRPFVVGQLRGLGRRHLNRAMLNAEIVVAKEQRDGSLVVRVRPAEAIA